MTIIADLVAWLWYPKLPKHEEITKRLRQIRVLVPPEKKIGQGKKILDKVICM